MTISFELLHVSKMSNLRITSPVMEKLEALNLNSRVFYPKSSIEYPASERTDVITPYSRDFEKISLSLVSGATVTKFGQ